MSNKTERILKDLDRVVTKKIKGDFAIPQRKHIKQQHPTDQAI